MHLTTLASASTAQCRRLRTMCVGVALFLAATTVACSRGETARSGATEGSSAAADVATALESPAGAQSGEPFLFTDARGKVLMTWLEKRGDSRYALRFSALSGNEWSTPTTIAERNDFFVNWADFPSVVRTESGRLVAHWLQKSGSSKYAYDVRISQSIDDGRSWSPGSVLNRDGVQAEHGFVALWPSEGDRVGAAWLDGRASLAKDTTQRATHVMTTSISADGTLGAESTLDTRTCDCCQVAVAVASRGPIVAYRDRTSDETRDIVVTRRVNGKWSEPALVHHDDWKIAACPVNGPALSARGDTVVIAWFTGAQDSARVRFARSVDGGTTFGAPTRIDDGNPAGRVDVELVEGGAIVSWLERTTETNAEVRLRRIHDDNSLGSMITVARSSGARASGFPKMARRGSELIAAWTEPGESGGVRVARISLDRIP